jgi:hypothetical protein
MAGYFPGARACGYFVSQSQKSALNSVSVRSKGAKKKKSTLHCVSGHADARALTFEN